MIFLRQTPPMPLAAAIDHLWFFEGFVADHQIEHVVPDGTLDLVIDLREVPRRLYDRRDIRRFRSMRRGWISGAQSGYLVIDVQEGASMIGARFRPGGASRLLGSPVDEVTDQVIELDALWGVEANLWREQLLAASSGRKKLAVLEKLLLRRWQRSRRPSWGGEANRISLAMSRLAQRETPPSGADLADEFGISHKHFISEFRRSVGLTPKLFGRVRRFQSVLTQIHAGRPIEWADVACRCGYFDQAHFVRDFKNFAGLNPTAFLRQTAGDAKFLPLAMERAEEDQG